MNFDDKEKEEFIKNIFENNRILSDDDIYQISTRYRAGFYALALDFLWRRLRLKIKDFYQEYNNDFINTMVFIPLHTMPHPFACYDIQLLYQLGVVDKKQKFELLKVFIAAQSNITNPTLNQKNFENILELCMESIFNKDFREYQRKIKEISTKLITIDLTKDEEFLQTFLQGDHHYISAAIKYLLYKYEYCKNVDYDLIENNLSVLVSNGWSDLEYEDKLQLNFLANCGENVDTRNLCKRLLNTADTSLLTTESKNLPELVVTCKRVISSYYSFKYREYLADALYLLSKINYCPIQYSNLYIGSSLLCLISQKEDHNENTKAYAEKIIKNADKQMLQYYFNNCLSQDHNLLLALTTIKASRVEFSNWLKSLDLKDIVIQNNDAQTLLTAGLLENYGEISNIAKELLYK